ncbi:sorting nexin-24-like [Macrobrachium nipponense]|uniref:sorting nexin-24-like n=1 Tax=Macrobrachium nipponense TaxID=159736 RepID=UPI0030C8B109
MIRAYIPRYRLVEGESGRSHYVYTIEVCYLGKVHRIEKRYSAFHSLYKELRKLYPTAEFPPKRLRNTTSKVLETRRAGLELWLHSALLLQPSPPALLSFLQVSNYQLPHQECEGSGSEESPSHQPMLIFTQDPYLAAHTSSTNLPNMLSKGVITALYDPSFQMPA